MKLVLAVSIEATPLTAVSCSRCEDHSGSASLKFKYVCTNLRAQAVVSLSCSNEPMMTHDSIQKAMLIDWGSSSAFLTSLSPSCTLLYLCPVVFLLIYQ